MAEYIEREAALSLVRPDTPEDEKAAITIVTAKKLVRSIVRRTPAADVAPVVRGKPITKIREVTITEYHEARGVFASDGSNVYIKNMVHAKVPYDHCPVCGAVLCSRWHNYCGKCGAKMDGGNGNG